MTSLTSSKAHSPATTNSDYGTMNGELNICEPPDANIHPLTSVSHAPSADCSASRRSRRGQRRVSPAPPPAHRISDCSNQQVQEWQNRSLSYQLATPIYLTSIDFQVPHYAEPLTFVGRQWLFKDIYKNLTSCPGIMIQGESGSGKTSIVEQILDFSCFGQKQFSLEHMDECFSWLCKRVSAVHLSSSDNNMTCMLPEFVHSLAAYLSKSALLGEAYSDHLRKNPNLQILLNMKNCIENPRKCFIKGILDPLLNMKPPALMPVLICVDSLDEAEYHRPDAGETIGDFLRQVVWPNWVKVIYTCRSQYKEIITGFKNYHVIKLHQSTMDINVSRALNNQEQDIEEYIHYRINRNNNLLNKIGVPLHIRVKEGVFKFVKKITTLSKGNFLFVHLLLNLLEDGSINFKSSNYKILPPNLHELFTLMLNLKFPTIRNFEQVSSIFSVCLSSLYPPTIEELNIILQAGELHPSFVGGSELDRKMCLVNGLIGTHRDRSLRLFHPTFREWLTSAEVNVSHGGHHRFHCDIRFGHTLHALLLSRKVKELTPTKTVELGHHILKSNIHKPSKLKESEVITAKDLNILWMSNCARNLTQALISPHNLFMPNIKVNKLLIQAGANINVYTDYLKKSSLLGVMSYHGCSDMVKLLLQHGAEVNATNDEGQSALILACKNGQIDCIRILLAYSAKVQHCDHKGRSAMIHCAISDQLDALAVLLQSDWSKDKKMAAVRNATLATALVSASASGNNKIIEFLLSLRSVSNFDMDDNDDILGENAVSVACCNNHLTTLRLLRARCSPSKPAIHEYLNSVGSAPLTVACGHGCVDIVDDLVGHGADVKVVDASGRSCLSVAASMGHLNICKLLLSLDVNLLDILDNKGWSAFFHAVSKSNMLVVQYFIEIGVNTKIIDLSGRGILEIAAEVSHPNIVKLLLDKCTSVSALLSPPATLARGCNPSTQPTAPPLHPLDVAVRRGDPDVVALFLQKGARLSAVTWQLAQGDTPILLLLLNKLLSDGNILYKRGDFTKSAERYRYALKKMPDKSLHKGDSRYAELQAVLTISLTRCKRSM